MKDSLIDLQNALFEQIGKLNAMASIKNVKREEIDHEVEKTLKILELAKTAIANWGMYEKHTG